MPDIDYTMYEARARGGPLHTIKLTAQWNWDGQIVLKRTTNSIEFHQGRYKWDAWERAWVWKECKVPNKTNPRKQTAIEAYGT